MTQKKNHSLRSIFFGFLLSSLALTSLYGQEGDPVKGKALFNANCAACHQLDKKMTGPALRYVETRLSEDEGLDREWLNAWIRNSNSVIKSGDAYANKIYNEYNGAAMTAYPQFSDDGGLESERTYVKQLVQKYVSDGSSEDLFNEEEIESSNV